MCVLSVRSWVWVGMWVYVSLYIYIYIYKYFLCAHNYVCRVTGFVLYIMMMMRASLKSQLGLSICYRLLATTSADQTCCIWRTADLSLMTKLRDQNQRWVWDCAFSGDSQYIITGTLLYIFLLMVNFFFFFRQREAVFFWCLPLSGISGLSVWSYFSISPLLFFCLVLSLFLSYPWVVDGAISLQ